MSDDNLLIPLLHSHSPSVYFMHLVYGLLFPPSLLFIFGMEQGIVTYSIARGEKGCVFVCEKEAPCAEPLGGRECSGIRHVKG